MVFKSWVWEGGVDSKGTCGNFGGDGNVLSVCVCVCIYIYIYFYLFLFFAAAALHTM